MLITAFDRVWQVPGLRKKQGGCTSDVTANVPTPMYNSRRYLDLIQFSKTQVIHVEWSMFQEVLMGKISNQCMFFSVDVMVPVYKCIAYALCIRIPR